MNENLHKFILTTDKLQILKSEISDIKASVFNSKVDLKDVMSHFVILNALLSYYGVSVNEKNSILESVKNIEDGVNSLAIVNLTLAFNPEERLLSQMVDLLSKYMKKNVIIDLTVDRNILGGVVFSYQGIYKNLSLKNLVSSYFTSNQEYVQKLLSR
jgi:F0F1-type ATP synthase delta subunit